MKNIYVAFALIFVSVFIISCKDRKQASHIETTAPADSSIQQVSIENYSLIFKQILKSDAGMARGVSIGDKIKTLQETILPSETQPQNGKSFTIYFDGSDLNFADILYVKDAENKWSPFRLIFLLKTKLKWIVL